MPQFETIASGVYKNRNYSDYNLTEVGNRFLLSQTKVKNGSNDERVLIFCSDVGLKVLAESKRWHVDGTFYTAVQFEKDKFQKFYLIHGMYKGHLLPCTFALSTNKTITTYRCLKSELKDAKLKSELKDAKLKKIFSLKSSSAFSLIFCPKSKSSWKKNGCRRVTICLIVYYSRFLR